MKQDFDELLSSVKKLRAEHAATTMALQCLLTVLTPDQQRQTLKALAQLSVMREESAAKSPNPAAQEETQRVVQALDRLYQGLQGAHKLRMSKLGEPPIAP
jgi:small-conductance mechanosensitive channel